MNDLSPNAQLLVRAGAKAARPSNADRQRLFEAMRERLGDAAMLGETATMAVAASGVWFKVAAFTVGVGLVVAGAAVALHTEPQPPAAVPAQPAASPERAAPGPAEPELEPAPAAISAVTEAPLTSAPAAPPAPAQRRPPDRLAQEVALLSRATSALRAGRAADALRVLGEHQAQFPKGVLSEERRAARAQALCALGRRNEAEADLTALSRAAPQSAQAARARQVCAGSR